MRNLLLIATLILTATSSFPADRITVTGKVTDKLGKPLEDAMVMVYAGGVKKGYSTYCPTCYVDCGKRTVTDRTGSFTIKSLNPDVLFDLLVIRDGYVATFVKRVDPSRGQIALQFERKQYRLSPRNQHDRPVFIDSRPPTHQGNLHSNKAVNYGVGLFVWVPRHIDRTPR